MLSLTTSCLGGEINSISILPNVPVSRYLNGEYGIGVMRRDYSIFSSSMITSFGNGAIGFRN